MIEAHIIIDEQERLPGVGFAVNSLKSRVCRTKRPSCSIENVDDLLRGYC